MSISKILLSITMTAILAAPVAIAAENHPDCENDLDYTWDGDGPTGPGAPEQRHGDQPWIGYARTDPVRAGYEDLGSPGGLRTCEGEHWDGEDPVSDADGNCNGAVAGDNVNRCLGDDPRDWSETDPLNTGVRVSTSGTSVYSAANIIPVGRAVLYTDGSSTVAVYVEDNTPGNLLATAVSAARVTQGFPSEGDCDQEEYQSGAYSQDARCGRDNTAITIQLAP